MQMNTVNITVYLFLMFDVFTRYYIASDALKIVFLSIYTKNIKWK